MALLLDPDHRTVALSSLTVLGRSSTAVVRLADARVSGAHARLAWTGERWMLRDLGSRNGTFVNGARVAHEERALAEGDRIALGSESLACTLLEATAPAPYARDERGGPWVRAEGEVLLLGSAPGPIVTVFRDSDGAWCCEDRVARTPVHDGARVTVGDARFVLSLPVALDPTVEAEGERAAVRHAQLLLRVSRDEERVEVVIRTRASHWVLPPRSHFYTLLLMARARQRDELARRLPEESRGWLTVDELCAQLATDENKINVDMHRIRRDFGRVGLSDGGAVIERRRGTGQLRLASAQIAIETTEA